ncbi:MAG TPA: hypothetical protein VF955_05245 [Pyrinomonadaceae bacterium]
MILGRISDKVKKLLRGEVASADKPNPKQALDLYWDPAMAEVLETWG